MKPICRFLPVLAAILAFASLTSAQPVIIQPPTNTPAVTAATPGRLGNLSVRARAGTDAQTLALGFVVVGDGEKPVLIRAIGPTLASFGVAGALADPRLQLMSGGAVLRANDNWGVSVGGGGAGPVSALSNAFAACGAFALDPASKDAAIIRSSAPGAYTAQVTTNGGSGVVLAELYDTAPAAGARLVNASARAQVGMGDDIIIAGFVIAGHSPVRVLVRAIGPGLAPFDVSGTLANPKLELFRGASLVAANDDWAGTPELVQACTQVGAFALPDAASRDAALVVTLEPGAYTAQVSGADGDTGVALVEIYEVP